MEREITQSRHAGETEDKSDDGLLPAGARSWANPDSFVGCAHASCGSIRNNKSIGMNFTREM